MYSSFMQDNAKTYSEKSLMTALEEENVQLVYAGQCHDLPRKVLNDRPRRGKCTVGLCRTMPRPTQKKSLMAALEEENVQFVYAGQCYDPHSKLLNERPRRGIRRKVNIHADCLRTPDLISYCYN
jgi:hypothetical protein